MGPVRGHEVELYEAHATRLLRIVAYHVRTTPENVEDACHFAWATLIRHADRVQRDAALTWLTVTATRYAYRLHRRQGRDVSLEAILEEGRPGAETPTNLAPERQVELRQELDLTQQLPCRERRMLWLQAAGLSYAEIADCTGASTRTVERQILRARRRLMELRQRGGLAAAPTSMSTTRGRKPPALGL